MSRWQQKLVFLSEGMDPWEECLLEEEVGSRWKPEEVLALVRSRKK